MSNIEERGFGVRQRPAEFVQNFEVLRNQCLKEKKLFKDPEFDTYDLTIHHKNLRKSRFEWRRPNKIANNPQFIMEGVSRFDVKQGELGDCWLLAAIANLTLNNKLFYQVVPYDQGFYTKYAGIFHFRFWQYGKWVDVVIDDRLPTYDGKLIYLQSAMKNEFWSALLEKAYAKIHGSYKALDGGFTMEGMGDFTGGVSEIYDLNDVQHDLLTIMLNSIQRQSLMCGSISNSKMIDVSEKGLHKAHAYSITKITSISIENKNLKSFIYL